MAEVQFFFRVTADLDSSTQRTFALVSTYSAPDSNLLSLSHGTLWFCEYTGDANLSVIDVEAITSVIAMLPHPVLEAADAPENRAGSLFVVEKLGLDPAMLDNIDDSIDRNKAPST